MSVKLNELRYKEQTGLIMIKMIIRMMMIRLSTTMMTTMKTVARIIINMIITLIRMITIRIMSLKKNVENYSSNSIIVSIT